MILTVRIDQTEVEIALVDSGKIVVKRCWPASRQLSMQLLPNIEILLKKQNKKQTDFTGIIYFSGPGSFTGLRIGASVCASLGYALGIPAIGIGGEDWQQKGIKQLRDGSSKSSIVRLEYGAPAHITKPIK